MQISERELPASNRMGDMGLILAETSTTIIHNGIGLGAVIAVVCSWQRNRSILWAILAGICSWFYVVYFALTRRADETK